MSVSVKLTGGPELEKALRELGGAVAGRLGKCREGRGRGGGGAASCSCEDGAVAGRDQSPG